MLLVPAWRHHQSVTYCRLGAALMLPPACSVIWPAPVKNGPSGPGPARSVWLLARPTRSQPGRPALASGVPVVVMRTPLLSRRMSPAAASAMSPTVLRTSTVGVAPVAVAGARPISRLPALVADWVVNGSAAARSAPAIKR